MASSMPSLHAAPLAPALIQLLSEEVHRRLEAHEAELDAANVAGSQTEWQLDEAALTEEVLQSAIHWPTTQTHFEVSASASHAENE